MMPTGVLTDDLADVIGRAAAPVEVPTVVAGCGVPSAASDGSPSRDRLARIAAMIHDAEHAATAGGVRETDAGRLIPLLPRVKRARLRAAGTAAVVLAG
jgi:hypothetical protein